MACRLKNSSASCAWKTRIRAKGGPAKSATLIHSGTINKDSAKYSTIVDVDIYEKLRPRTGHFAFARCSPGGVGRIDVDLELSNPTMGWLQHFSKDEQLLAPLNSACLLVYYVLLGIQLQALLLLRNNSGVILAAALFMLLVCKVIAVTVRELELVSFASSGKQWIRDVREHTVNVGTLLSSVFDSLFWVGVLCMLALISNGWMVVSPMIRSRDPDTQWSAAAMARLLVVYTMMFLVASLTRETASANMLDAWHTMFGFVVVAVEAWIVWIVLRRLARRFKDETIAANGASDSRAHAQARDSRMVLYATCGVLCAGRVLAEVAVLAVTFLVDNWVEHSVVFAVSSLSRLLSFLILCWVLRPRQLLRIHGERFGDASGSGVRGFGMDAWHSIDLFGFRRRKKRWRAERGRGAYTLPTHESSSMYASDGSDGPRESETAPLLSARRED